MKKIQKVILLLLAVVASASAFLSYEFVTGFSSTHKKAPAAANQITTTSLDTQKLPDEIKIMLIGSDAREDGENGRSDTLMLAQYNRKTKTPKLISIMRDSYVPITGYGQDKINAAYSYGGLALLQDTLKNNFNVDIPYYVSITFQDFIDCLDEIFPDGVKITAEKEIDLDGVHIEPGTQTMDGNTLLQYARFRKDEEGDFGRVRRQQQVMEAIAEQAQSLSSILKLPKVIGKVIGSIDTNLPSDLLLSFGMDFIQGKNKPVTTLSVPIDDSWEFNDNTVSGSVIELDLEANKKAIEEFWK